MQTLQSKDTGFSPCLFVLRNCLFVELCSDPFYKSPDADAAKEVVSILLEKRSPRLGIEPGTSQSHTHALTNYTKDHH